MAEQGTLLTPDALSKVLTDLLMDRRVNVNKSAPMRLPPPAPFVLATYKSDDGKSAFVCVSDLALASAASAALTLIPPNVAAESVRAGKLSEELSENVREIFNVCAGLFNRPDAPHFVLEEVTVQSKTLSGPLAAAMAKPRARSDFEVSISGYSSGKLSIWAINVG